MKKALIIVDPQNDFFTGTLAVLNSLLIIPLLNALMKYAEEQGWLIIISRDWHPKKTKHFKKYGGTWDEHCVQHTWGAQFHPDLKIPKSAIIISKGMSRKDDGYSPFEGRVGKRGKFLDQVMKKHQITTVYVAGLATDYCVKACVLDSQQKFGYDTIVIDDAVKAVNIHPTDEAEAFFLMRAAYAHVTKTQEVCNEN